MTQEQMPKVSIICLGLNHSKYVEQCINALVNQTYKNIEIIFIDANSNDDTFEKGKELLEKSSVECLCIKNNPRLNISQNLNLGIKKSSGEYISIASCDDWLDLKSVEEKVDTYLKNPLIGMVYSNGYTYNDDQDTYTEINSPFPGVNFIFEELLKKNFLHNKGFLVHKSVFEKVGLFDESNMIEDWEMSLRIAKVYPIAQISKRHFNYRIHDSNMSQNPSIAYYEDCFRVVKKYKNYKNHYDGIDWLMKGYIKALKEGKISLIDRLTKVIKLSGFRRKTLYYLKKAL